MWGPPEPSNIIILNDQPFVIQQNIFIALNTLRHTSQVSRPRVPWIDALCEFEAD
ncbi:hypothetical protein BKA65DRAFT_486449 [Rhexocercosporidium sp. MPI-PUGE-AT-0058]|nr:hypothetical protein BKA65DRAFT_486449 [Rhexocercosporidium sp. MPI-PUGE-AT-0058]